MVIDTLDTLIQRVLAEDARKHDLLADTRRMSLGYAEDDEGKVENLLLDVDDAKGVETLVLSPHAQGQMATDLGIPKRYYDRMRDEAPELLQRNAHHWMYEEPHRRMIRAYKNDGGNATA